MGAPFTTYILCTSSIGIVSKRAQSRVSRVHSMYSKCQIPEISKNVPLNPKEMHSSVTLLPHFFYAY